MRKVIMSCVVALTVAGCSELPIDGLTRSGWKDPATMPRSAIPKTHGLMHADACTFQRVRAGCLMWVPASSRSADSNTGVNARFGAKARAGPTRKICIYFGFPFSPGVVFAIIAPMGRGNTFLSGRKFALMIGLICLTVSACDVPLRKNSAQDVTFFSLLPHLTETFAARQPAPDGYDAEYWVDRDGCSFISTGSGEWVPRLNINRTLMCDAEAAEEANEFAAISQPDETPDLPPISVDPDTGIVTEVVQGTPVSPSFVQIGTYDDTANGMNVRARFAAMGFPIVGGDATPPEGKPMAVVWDLSPKKGFWMTP